MRRIAVDIGNSRISCGVFDNGSFVESWHIPTSNADEACLQIEKRNSNRNASIAICSVVPSATDQLTRFFKERRVPCILLTAGAQNFIHGTYPTLGTDRVANLAAAMQLYNKSGNDLSVLDFGTATTLTAVDSRGKFLGGYITLGLGKTVQSLNRVTEQLPRLAVDRQRQSDDLDLGMDTTTNIIHGCLLAHVGIIEQWVKASREKLDNPTIVATGGYAPLLSAYTDMFEHVDVNLTLFGINIIAEAAAVPGGQA